MGKCLKADLHPGRKPIRRFWQLHLSTALLLMLLTGVFLGVEMSEHRQSVESECMMRGIPFPMQKWEENPKPGIIYLFETNGITHDKNGWSYWLLAANVLCCVLVLIGVACISEWILRRRLTNSGVVLEEISSSEISS